MHAIHIVQACAYIHRQHPANQNVRRIRDVAHPNQQTAQLSKSHTTCTACQVAASPPIYADACLSQHQQHNSASNNSGPQPQAPSQPTACRTFHSSWLGTVPTRWRSILPSAVPAVGGCALLLWQGLDVRGRRRVLAWYSSALLGGLVPAGWHLHGLLA